MNEDTPAASAATPTGPNGAAAPPPSDPALRAALARGAMALAGITVVMLAVWAVIARLPGVWGALVGAAIGGFFLLTTVITVLSTARLSPSSQYGAILGGWLLKIAVVIAVVWALGKADFYSREAFVFTLVAVLVVVLWAETRAILGARVPYVTPE